jgi:hypothetical protein
MYEETDIGLHPRPLMKSMKRVIRLIAVTSTATRK